MTMAPPQPHEEFISRPRLDEHADTPQAELVGPHQVPARSSSALFGFFVAAEVADNPILPISEAFDTTLREQVVAPRARSASRCCGRSTT